MTIEISARRERFNRGVSLYYANISESGVRVAEPITLKEHKDCDYSPPMITLDDTAAQKLMDELWNCGLRPSEGSGSAGALLATQNHLKDMQSITFGLLNKRGVSK